MWKNNIKKQFYTVIFSTLLFLMLLTISWISYFAIPAEQRIVVGEQLDFNIVLPKQILSSVSIHLTGSNNPQLKIDGNLLTESSFQLISSTNNPIVTQPGKLELEFKLFDRIPLRKVSLEVVPERLVFPGGQSIGVLLQAKGVLVVGFSPVYVNNNQVFPAKQAGIREGDFILSINGQNVTSDLQIAQIIDQQGADGKDLTIAVKQGDKENSLKVKPQYCQDTNRYRIGLFVRDTTAGVGTLSFYDNYNRIYGALGHVIADSETNKAIDISRGKIVTALIKGIEIGRRGQPGEKIGIFQEGGEIIGSIEKNSQFGIFGSLNQAISHSVYEKPIPVAFGNQIKQGKAQILTVVSEDKVEVFDIEIERINTQSRPNGKGMVIRITDEKLLKLTGGIVQGMSGSPIIQNGKLVGAVTHVFVNDPTRGYGILVEWMLEEADQNHALQFKAQSLEQIQALQFFCLFL